MEKRTWGTLLPTERKQAVKLYNSGMHDKLEELSRQWGIAFDTLCRRAREVNHVLTDFGGERPNYEAPPEYFSPSVQQQMALFDESKKRWEYFRNVKSLVRVMWIGDQHFPYEDPRAWNLVCQIREDFQPDVAVNGGDEFDFDGYANWNNRLTPAAKLWQDDIENGYRYKRMRERELDSAYTPEVKIRLNGNHCMWFYNFLRENARGAAEKNVTDWIRFLVQENDELVFSDKCEAVQLNMGLKILHGWGRPSDLPANYAKKMIEDNTEPFYSQQRGTKYDVMYGHDHRQGIYYVGPNIAYSVGCVSSTEVRYGSGSPFNWQQGCAVGTVNMYGQNHNFEILPFYNELGHLVTYWRDKRYVSA